MSTTASPSPAPPSLATVLALAGRGWRVFPCRSRDKRPLVRGWQHILLGRTHWTPRHEVKAGRLKSVRIGRCIMMEPSEIRGLLEGGRR